MQLLRGYCNKHPKLWDESLHYVKDAYNRAFHSSTNRSPFETCYGYLPKSPMNFVFSHKTKEDGYDNAKKAMRFIQKTKKMHKVVQEHLEKSQAKYKMRHDKHRADHHFKVGDQVWIYISKERLKGEGKRLKSIRYGPFKIVEKIGDNAF